ncbi:MAG TPA: hypothetical protein DCG75_01340 [Bacteroidales bacterium]|jgi:iron complex transport system substrate-binding protein|nr:hypothetical protein [Bacteroidales bacterium]
MRLIVAFLITIFISFSCTRENSNSNNQKNELSKDVILEYAKGFSIEDRESYQIVTIRNPWQGAEGVEYKYVLIDKNIKIPKYLKKYTIIRTPIERVVCLSTTHVAFIDVINKSNTIVGISGLDYVNNKKIRKAINQQKVFDVGYDSNLNYELIVSLKPDLVITYGVGGQVSSYNQRLNDLGIKTIIVAEYLETDPLGKLEWIKLIASLYNEEEHANLYFNKAEQEYNQLVELTKTVNTKPKVLFGLPWKDAWYVPGGKSFLAKMVDDAGGEYIWKENQMRESIPFDVESIFINASDAEVWLNTGTVNNKQDILKLDERFKDFTPFQKAKIYNNNLQINEFGGIDYWESGLVQPQIVLKDMIKIIHPELLPDHELAFYKIIE